MSTKRKYRGFFTKPLGGPTFHFLIQKLGLFDPHRALKIKFDSIMTLVFMSICTIITLVYLRVSFIIFHRQIYSQFFQWFIGFDKPLIDFSNPLIELDHICGGILRIVFIVFMFYIYFPLLSNIHLFTIFPFTPILSPIPFLSFTFQIHAISLQLILIHWQTQSINQPFHVNILDAYKHLCPDTISIFADSTQRSTCYSRHSPLKICRSTSYTHTNHYLYLDTQLIL